MTDLWKQDWQKFLDEEADRVKLTDLQKETLKASYPEYDSNLTVTQAINQLNRTKATYHDQGRMKGVFNLLLKDSPKNGKYTALRSQLQKEYKKKYFNSLDLLWNELKKLAQRQSNMRVEIMPQKSRMGATNEKTRGCILSTLEQYPQNSPYIPKVLLNADIQIKICLEEEDLPVNMIILEKDFNQNYYGILSPSLISPNIFQQNQEVVTIPNKEMTSIKMLTLGKVEHLAIITKTKLEFDWLKTTFNENNSFVHISLSNLKDLNECCSQLNNNRKDPKFKIFLNQFEVIEG